MRQSGGLRRMRTLKKLGFSHIPLALLVGSAKTIPRKLGQYSAASAAGGPVQVSG